MEIIKEKMIEKIEKKGKKEKRRKEELNKIEKDKAVENSAGKQRENT